MKLKLIIGTFAALTISVCASAQQQKGTAYIVSDAHLDTQWNWDIKTTIDEYVWNTLYRNLYLMDTYPDYIFNFEGGVKYYWMKEYYPDYYAKLKERIKEGRWHLCGSSWDATDAIVPSMESAIRNILLGQTFYRQEFGTESTDIFLPDCFGFGWTLPTIASHCGLIGFSSQKLQWRHAPYKEGVNERYPFPIGLWQGIDGSRIMFAHAYNYTTKWNDEDLSESKYLKGLTDASPIGKTYHYYGTGDVGGSPTIASVRSVEKGLKGDGPVKIISATSDQMFKDYQPYDKHPELPVYDGELTMDVHGTGCYTSEAAMKYYNRQNEQLADAGERANAAADWLGSSEYPTDKYTENWRRFIFHQFHDDLTGTSIPRAYEFSWNDELITMKQFSELLTKGVDGVAREMDTRVNGTPLVLYNPNDCAVSEAVRVQLPCDGKHASYTIYNEKGAKVSSQVICVEDGQATVLFKAVLPANGYAVYSAKLGGGKFKAYDKSVSALDNAYWSLKFDDKGDLVSVFDKKAGKELVESGKAIRLAIFTENESFSWPAWEVLKKTIDQDPVSIDQNVSIRLVEDGALRKTVCVEKHWGESTFKQYISIYNDCSTDRVEFFNDVDWNTQNALVKAEFPFSFSNPEATYSLGLGSIRRGNNSDISYEVYAHQWADLTAADGSYGAAVMNFSKYGWDKPSDNTLRLTLLHTPKTNRGYRYQDRQDLGHHFFTYALTGHKGELDQSSVACKAMVLNQPVRAFVSPAHSGSLGKSFSFASSNNPNVVIKAIKKAEVSDEFVVRVYETGGKSAQKAEISFAGEIVSAQAADGTEKSIGAAEFKGRSLKVEVPANGLATYKVVLKKKNATKAADTYQSIELPFDRRCFSWNAMRYEVSFGGGLSYAAELLPDKQIVSNGIPFTLGDKDAANGLSCDGQEIAIPDGCNRVYVLAASNSKDFNAEFTVGGSTTSVLVPYFTGFVGQWGHYGHTQGYLKDADIAFVGTHSHSAKADQSYEFTYMFRYGFDVPAGAKAITLPANKAITVFAMTAANELYPEITPAGALFCTANVGAQPDAADSPKAVARPDNILKNAKVIASSGAANPREAAQFLMDGNEDTKWCDNSHDLPYVDFDFGKPTAFKGWRVLNAGAESASYITRAAFLQGRNDRGEDWKTIDGFDANNRNDVTRSFKPCEFRYLRLLVTSPTQGGGDASRIYELEIY